MQYDQFFAGEYQLEKLLERSPYSALVLGKKSATGQEVLLKLWLTAQVTSEEEMARIREEVVAFQQIGNAHLLPVLEVRADEHKVYLVSAAAAQGSLNERLGRDDELGSVSLEGVLQIIAQTGQALQAMHQAGLVHGNLTPQAIFFDETGQVQLGEFLLRSVLACIPDYQHLLDENVPRCLYMAPEQFSGTLSPLTDQYALGCVAYLLLTGRVPFAGSTRAALIQKHQEAEIQPLSDLHPALPQHIEAAVLKSLSRRPEERHSSIQAFLAALDVSGERVLADQSTLTQPASDEAVSLKGSAWEWEEGAADDVPDEATLILPALVQAAVVKAPLLARPQPVQQRRAWPILVPAACLVLILLFVTGHWLFFTEPAANPASPVQPTRLAAVQTPTAVYLTPATVTSGEATAAATVSSLQVPTATPTAKPGTSSTPTPTPTPTSTPTPTPSPTPGPVMIQVPLTALFNNKGIATAPDQANFDGSGYAYPASQLPAAGLITVQGVVYQFPGYRAGSNDNISASGQTISLPPGKYHEAFLLVASSWGPASGTFIVRYSDGSTASALVPVVDWYTGPTSGLSTTNRYSTTGIDPHPAYIYVLSIALNASNTVSALVLPGSLVGGRVNAHIHVFALTLHT